MTAMHYTVAMPYPESHLFEVILQISNEELSQVIDLKMPVWTPGSYLVREYSRHLQGFQVMDGEQQSLSWQKVSKSHWQIQAAGVLELIVKYQIFANDLSVRTNHLDITHGYFNGAALFFYIPGREKQPIEVTIHPPKNWHITTVLPKLETTINTFIAEDFDTLVDSPFEIGTHQVYEFEVLGKTHQLAIWGQGNADPEPMIADMEKIIATEAKLFGGLPYDHYLFLLHLSGQGFGGLEHKFCCSLNYPRLGFRQGEKYERFMQLVAHEFFHLWNVKRIRPKALEVFDYDQENYTPSLWFSEGTTSYYDLMFPLRAGIYDRKTCLQSLSREITRYLTTPGRYVQSVTESSWDAWIKLYRRDANSDNCQISYYLKGEMISLLLDLLIRAKFSNQRSLDDVMVKMWREFGQDEIGFTPADLKGVIESVAGEDLTEFWQQYLDGTDDLPFDQYLEPFGLILKADDPGNSCYLGIKVASEGGREIIKFVESCSPAQQAGINPDDQLLAINGIRITADQLNERLKDFQAEEEIEVTIFHQDQLRTVAVTLGVARPTNYQLVPAPGLREEQSRNLEGWLS